MQDVPCLDMRELARGGAARSRFAGELRAALVETGFVRLAGHGIPTRLVREVFAAMQRFFSLPEDVKTRCGSAAGGARGYTAFGIEHAKDQRHPDLKEFFHVGRELPAGHPLRRSYAPNRWPDEVPELRPAALAAFAALDRCAARLLEATALGFDLARDTFSSMAVDGNSVLRALHYPPVPTGADSNALRAAPHEDINLITLLCGATDAGLEILTPDGVWAAVPAKPGEIVADAGDMLSRLTNDVIPATTHRVVDPPCEGDGRAPQSRYALPFFAHPRPEVDLSVLAAFVQNGAQPRYPPINAGAFLAERLREIGLG